MDINAIIEDSSDYWPFHGPGYTNHLPMAQCALYHLGANELEIHHFTEGYLKRFDLMQVASPGSVGNLQEHLGQREYYQAYVKFFSDKIQSSSLAQVVSETLNALALGLSSTLFHGLIRINYAMTLKDKREVSRALASLACAYEPVEFNGQIIMPDQMYDQITRYIVEREGLFYMEGKINTKIETILEGLLRLYLKTGSFVVLHTLTGLEALLSLRVYFDDFTHILDVFMVSVLRVLLRISAEDYKTIEIPENRTWEEIIELVKHVDNAHTVKFAYSLKKLSRHYGFDEMKAAIQLKLKIDHHI